MPVIVRFSEKTSPIWEIPFPSIVLCPESRVVNGTFNFTEAFYQVIDNPDDDKFRNISTTDYEYLQTLSQICDVDLVDRLKFEKAEPIDVLRTMVNLAPTVNYTMPFAMWKHGVVYPDGLFTTVFTDLGVCHQFNGMRQTETLRYPRVPGQCKLRSNSNISDVSAATDIVALQNIKYGNSRQAIWGILLDYSTISTIHGVRYMVARRRSWWERAMWICIFIGAVSICYHLISKIWLKWETTPVIVSFSEKTSPIWEIPFPSIVLCPESRVVNGTFNFTEAFYQVIDNPDDDKFGNLSTTDYEYLQTLSQICDVDLVDRLKFEKAEPIDVLRTMVNLAPTVNYTMPFAMWKHGVVYPDGLFTTVFTDLGVCHQFNGMHQTETLRYPSTANFTFEGEVRRTSTWSLNNGYSHRSDDENTFPERVVAPGARGGIFMVTQGFLQDIDYLCRGSVEGFSLQLLSPDEYPAANKQYIRVPFNKDVSLIIKPHLITTSEGLKSYSSERRQCFFNEERYLKFFNAYTQNNCMFECLTNFTFAQCGCVKFNMPRTEDMRICQASEIGCYYKAEDDLLQEQFESGLTGKSRNSNNCNCLPACTSLAYEVEISQANFDVFKVLEAYKETYEEENPGLKMGRTSIFFKEQQFLTLRRSELYGTTDFLASSGGLLGLFLGISALSIVELIYFCTVRLISNLRMRRRSRATKLEFN